MPGPDPLELPAPVLEAALARLVGDDEAAREHALAELLAQHPAHGDQLRALHDTLGKAGRLLAHTFAAPAAAEPERIDGYRVVRRLGEGAFGVVYLGEQDEPIRRHVALKLLRPGAGDRGTLARFDSERRFLARLNHPTIAQIFDAGLLADGRPWFVMEHVAGVPINEYCDRAQLPIEARLSLFARLCQGVQHAHEQGIVHRDLKPANVLVVEIDGEAQPKIIDFGIAKALEQRGEHGAVRTETGRVVGTPGYMSPEQAEGRLDEVDARSDLFSLGVLLYELLTGELPWGKRPDSTASDPPRPSVRVNTGTQAGTTIAQQRGSQPRKLARHLRGDLDWIVLKALSRERPRRYASALELAAEVHRHLRGEPVHAGPPSLAYRLRKFARRRRTALSTGAAVVVMAAIGLWFVTQARSEASLRGRDAESAVASLLARADDKDLLDKPGAEPVRKALAEDALAFYDQFLRERPDDLTSRGRRAKALWTLSQVHWLLGEFARSEAMAREAVTDGEALVAAEPANADHLRALARAERNLGRAIFSRGRRPEARPHFEHAIALLERCPVTEPGVGTGDLVRALIELHSTMNLPAEAHAADELLRRASELQEERVRKNPDHTGERDSLAHLDLKRALAALGRGDLTAAKERLQRPARWLAEGAEVLPTTAASVHALSSEIAAAQGDLETAIEHRQDGIAACHAWVEKEPAKPHALFQLGGFLVSLAELQNATSRYDDLTNTYRAAVELGDTWATRFPEDPRAPDYCTALTNHLVVVLLQPGRRSALAGAERAARRARELLAKLPESMPRAKRLHRSWTTMGHLGMVADALDLADAADVWRETAAAMAAYRATEPVTADVAAEYVLYSLRIARRELDAERTADAETHLALAKALVDEHRAANADVAFHAAELAKLRARSAAQRGELSDAAAAAETALAAGEFRSPTHAAYAMSAVWRAAKGRGVDATPWRSRAIELCEEAIPSFQGALPERDNEPWGVVRLAHLQLLLALAQRDAGTPFDTAAVEHALDTLATLRHDVHANEWDEEVFAAGKTLLAR